MHCILRVVKLKTAGAVAASCAHTFRDVATPNADSERTRQNISTGASSTRAVLAGVRRRLPAKRRKDAVLCLEYLVTASPAFFAGGQQQRRYFAEALKWLCARHGSTNVVSATVHLDESTPHMAVYVVPLTADGRLAAKDFVGGAAKLSSMQTNFHESVGRRFGLERGQKGSKARHQTVKRFYQALNTPVKSLPTLSAVDHLACAVGISTSRVEERDRATTLLMSRATSAADAVLGKLQGQVATLSLQVQHERARADGLAESNRQAVAAREADRLRYSSQIDRLKAQLSTAQSEVRGWVQRMRQIATQFQLPWATESSRDHSLNQNRKTLNDN